MTHLAAYFDDSKNEDEGIVVVAGYVGPVETWNMGFNPAWWRALDAMPRKVAEFKASDCRQGVQSFADWTKHERNELTTRVISVVTDPAFSDIVGIGAAALIGPADRDQFRNEYRQLAHILCVIAVIGEVLALSEGRSDDIHFTFDRQPGLEYVIQEVFRHMPASPSSPKLRLPPPRFSDSQKLAPLQAADLLAYETYKEMKSRQESPPRRPSAALKGLLDGRVHIATYFDLNRIRTSIQHGQSEALPRPALHSPFAIAYDSLSTGQIRQALQFTIGNSVDPAVPSWFELHRERRPFRIIAGLMTHVLKAMDDIRDVGISQHADGTLSKTAALNLVIAHQHVLLHQMQRVMDTLKPDAAMDERMGDLLLELADAIAVFLVQLPELVAKAAEGSVWTLRTQIAGIMGHANRREY